MLFSITERSYDRSIRVTFLSLSKHFLIQNIRKLLKNYNTTKPEGVIKYTKTSAYHG